MVSFAVLVVPVYEALIVGMRDKMSREVVTVNVALVAPAGTVTAAGTRADEGSSLDSATCAPPPGAMPFSVTVPVEEFPPATVEGSKARDERVTIPTLTTTPAEGVS